MHLLCPHCRCPIEVVHISKREEIACPSCGSTFRLDAESTVDWRPVNKTMGKFEILATVGQGAFATVYKARDTELDRTVAIKVPRLGNLADSDDMDRFLREARSVAQLRHPSIVSVHDVSEVDSVPYLVSDFVEGMTLADLLSAQTPPPLAAAELIASLAEAVHYAHQQGVIHRDIKPSNIMLERADDGNSNGQALSLSSCTPRIMDFGLAKRDGGEITMTVDGQILGTPAYMSPEQARGESHEVDARSDVYSLGVVLYQMLTGELPFRGTARMLLHQVIHDDPKPPRSLNDRIPHDLQTICLKAMSKEPERRYLSAAEMAADLRRLLKGEPIHARPTSIWFRSLKWVKRRPAIASLSALTMLLTIVGIVGIMWGWQSAVGARQEAVDKANQLTDALEQADNSLYVNRIMRAEREWLLNGDVVRARNVLRSCIPRPKQPDLRHWEWYYLQRLFQGGIATYQVHKNVVTGVCFSPNGKEIISASYDGTVQGWDFLGRHTVFRIHENQPIQAVAVDPRRKKIAYAFAAGESSFIKIHDLASNKCEQLLPITGVTISGLQFDPQGKFLAAASKGAICVWDTQEWKQVLKEKCKEPLNCLAFDSSGKRLAAGLGKVVNTSILQHDIPGTYVQVGGNVELIIDPPKGLPKGENSKKNPKSLPNGQVKIWNTRNWQAEPTLQLHSDAVSCLSFSPNDRLLATGSFDKTVKIWDFQSQQNLLTFRGHEYAVCSVAFAPDGKRIASANPVSFDLVDPSGRSSLSGGKVPGKILIWDPKTGTVHSTLRGHSKPVTSICFNTDGKLLASASVDRTVRLWDATSKQFFQSSKQFYKSGKAAGVLGRTIAFTPDGGQIISAGVPRRDNPKPAKKALAENICIWDAKDVRKVDSKSTRFRELVDLDVSKDGAYLALAEADGSVAVWDVWSQAIKSQISLGHPISRVSISPNKQSVAIGFEKGKMIVWNITNDNKTLIRTNGKGLVSSLVFSPDSRFVAVSHTRLDKKEPPGSELSVWDAATGKRAFHLRRKGDVVGNVLFSPDGNRLAVGNFDGSVQLIDWTTGKTLTTLGKHFAPVTALAFTSDGRRLASGSLDKVVKLWTLRSGEEILTLRDAGVAASLAFSPHDRRLASISQSATLRVWDAGGQFAKRIGK